MPSIEKAILDPFAPMSVGDALMVAVCGMVVVFIVLAVLALMIMVISKVVGFIEGKKPVAPAPKAAPAAAPAPKKEDDEEIIAVITAAVAAEMGTTPDQTRLTSVMRY
ncbi:MAG: OadG family protein [Oscillospiraceae bacterium]|nr:OadG family protein [Oscillospiraceae bacterium]